MKKGIALFMALTMAFSALTACGNETKGSVAVSETEKSSVASETEVASTEVVEEIAYPEEISVFCMLGGTALSKGFTDNNESYWAQEMEKLTGTHVEWKHVASEVVNEKFNLMIASEEYTDAIVHDWANVEGGAELYEEDGVILDLTELIPECMPNLNAFLEEHPDVKKIMTNTDGKILTIPMIREDVELCIYLGPQMRTDWLEKLGLEVPKTTDDLYTVLKAFKEKDPNGNGEADEIPMSGVGFGITNEGMGIGNLLWAFDTHYSFYVKDGKVVWGPAEEQFTEGLAYITKLYQEGLIDIDYLLNDRAAMDSKALNDRVGFMYSYQPSKYFSSKTFNDGTKMMMGIPHLTNNDSKSSFYSSYGASVVNTVALAVSTTCEDPKGLLKWLDTIYSEEGIVLSNFGLEGTHFNYVDDGIELIVKEGEELSAAKSTQQANTLIVASTFPILQQWDGYATTLSEWGKKSIATWGDGVDISGLLPQIKLTSDEKAQIADALAQLNTYIDTEINNVVIGKTSIDKWAEVLDKSKQIGLDKVLDVYNAAYQRYMNK